MYNLKIKRNYYQAKKEKIKSTNADWRPVHGALNAEIKLRNYSPKTFQSYRGWVRQLPEANGLAGSYMG